MGRVSTAGWLVFTALVMAATSTEYGRTISMHLMKSKHFEIVVFLVVGVSCLPFVWRYVISPPLRQKRALRLLAIGQTAMATIQSCGETGTYINRMPELRMLVEVHPPGAAPFQATKTFVLPSLTLLPRLQPGMPIQVSYDPADPSYIALLFDDHVPAAAGA